MLRTKDFLPPWGQKIGIFCFWFFSSWPSYSLPWWCARTESLCSPAGLATMYFVCSYCHLSSIRCPAVLQNVFSSPQCLLSSIISFVLHKAYCSPEYILWPAYTVMSAVLHNAVCHPLPVCKLSNIMSGVLKHFFFTSKCIISSIMFSVIKNVLLYILLPNVYCPP